MLGCNWTLGHTDKENDDGLTQKVIPVLGPIIFYYNYKQALLDE